MQNRGQKNKHKKTQEEEGRKWFKERRNLSCNFGITAVQTTHPGRCSPRVIGLLRMTGLSITELRSALHKDFPSRQHWCWASTPNWLEKSDCVWESRGVLSDWCCFHSVWGHSVNVTYTKAKELFQYFTFLTRRHRTFWCHKTKPKKSSLITVKGFRALEFLEWQRQLCLALEQRLDWRKQLEGKRLHFKNRIIYIYHITALNIACNY